MSTFSKGDKVRCIQTWTTHVIDRGGEYTVDDVRPDNLTDTMEALVRGAWVPFSYFEKVQPEWVVGQVIRNDDYDRLPIGASVELGLGFAAWTKGSDGLWRDASEVVAAAAEIKRFNRILTHLPDATQPEDATDAYVEPEPLKEGDAVLVWAEVQGSEWGDGTTPVHLPVPEPDLIFVRADAIVRPDAGQVPPWVKPVEEPLNIGSVVADRDDAVWARVATGDPGGPWWTRASEGPEESMTYPHHWGDLSVRRVLSEGYLDGGAS